MARPVPEGHCERPIKPAKSRFAPAFGVRLLKKAMEGFFQDRLFKRDNISDDTITKIFKKREPNLLRSMIEGIGIHADENIDDLLNEFRYMNVDLKKFKRINSQNHGWCPYTSFDQSMRVALSLSEMIEKKSVGKNSVSFLKKSDTGETVRRVKQLFDYFKSVHIYRYALAKKIDFNLPNAQLLEEVLGQIVEYNKMKVVVKCGSNHAGLMSINEYRKDSLLD